MPIWPALLVAPSLALTHLSVAYALVTPACAAQHPAWLHFSSAGFLALALVFTWQAFAEARRHAAHAADECTVDSDELEVRPWFIASVAASVGLLSSLVIIGIWIPQWLLSPCVA
jgi:hypothetical protein